MLCPLQGAAALRDGFNGTLPSAGSSAGCSAIQFPADSQTESAAAVVTEIQPSRSVNIGGHYVDSASTGSPGAVFQKKILVVFRRPQLHSLRKKTYELRLLSAGIGNVPRNMVTFIDEVVIRVGG